MTKPQQVAILPVPHLMVGDPLLTHLFVAELYTIYFKFKVAFFNALELCLLERLTNNVIFFTYHQHFVTIFKLY